MPEIALELERILSIGSSLQWKGVENENNEMCL